MSTEFKVPELGEGVESAEVSQIYVSEGDAIKADQPVMELETDKAVTDLPCPHAGTITKIHVSVGDTIEVGQTILTIEDRQGAKKDAGETEEPPSEEPEDETPAEPEADEEPDEEPEPEAEAEAEEEADEDTDEQPEAEAEEEPEAEPDEEAEEEPEDETPADEEPDQSEEPPAAKKSGKKKRRKGKKAGVEEEQQAAEPEQETQTDTEEPAGAEEQADRSEAEADADPLPPPAGPATRRLARELDVDLHEIHGSGSGGRITQVDIVQAHDQATPEAKPRGMSQPPLPDFQKFGPVERQPLNKIARTAMKHLSTSWTTVPHVTQHDLADITQLEAARRRYVEGAGQSGPKITLTAIAVKAVTTALKEFPRFNASLDEEQEELIIKQYYHIGVAVDTENGLLVPVIRDADGKTILEVAAELAELAERARSRKLSRADMEGATFTISNQGGIGGIAFTPIVSFPQVAILGMSRARPELQMNDGRPESRLMLPLSLSYDHRVINGADAARFLVRLSAELSDSFQFLIRA
jgi:pyruvate dehydrogenase E2 component (dihydrolipoamide acetyltransferase)